MLSSLFFYDKLSFYLVFLCNFLFGLVIKLVYFALFWFVLSCVGFFVINLAFVGFLLVTCKFWLVMTCFHF